MNSSPRNIFLRRELILELIKTDLRASTVNTRLGWIWWFADPLVMIGIYWFFFVIIFGSQRYPPYPIFVGVALIAWKMFAGSSTRAVTLLRSRRSLIKSTPFPTLIMPIAMVGTQTVYFLVGLLILATLSLIMGIRPGWHSLQIVPLVLLQTVLVLGVAAILAPLGAIYRDLESFLNQALRVGWYISPGIYGADMVRDRLFAMTDIGPWLFGAYMLNPFAILFVGYRGALHDPAWMPPHMWLILAAEAALVLLIGYIVYQHFDRRVLKFI